MLACVSENGKVQRAHGHYSVLGVFDYVKHSDSASEPICSKD